MTNGGDAAEQVVRLSLEGFEVAAKLSGAAAKNIAVLLVSVLKQEQKTNAADPEAFAQQGLFAVVADGMGGLEDGKAVSEGAVSGFLQMFQLLDGGGDIPQQLLEGTHTVNDALFQRFGGRGGTTAVAVRIFQDRLDWISVGDSAIYLMRSGGVFQVNREHTRLNELYLAELCREPSDKTRAETDETSTLMGNSVAFYLVRT